MHGTSARRMRTTPHIALRWTNPYRAGKDRRTPQARIRIRSHQLTGVRFLIILMSPESRIPTVRAPKFLRLRVVSSIIGRSLKVTDFIFIIFGAGAELKTVADALTGRMLRCEVAEGKHVHDKWEFEDVYQHTAATCMRLAQPWFSSGRIFCGDSWFGSVQSAIAHAKSGVHFIGLVKTAHSGFPKKQLLSKLKDKPIGTVVTMLAEIMNVKNIGIGSDLCLGQTDNVVEWMRNGTWSKNKNYGEGSKNKSGFPKQPEWFEDATGFKNLENGLRKVGFSVDDINGILGNNWFNFYKNI